MITLQNARAIAAAVVLGAAAAGSALAAALEQVAPLPATYAVEVDFRVMRYSGTGDVTAPVQAVDVFLGLGPTNSTSGCDAADFVGFAAGSIALMRRGVCTFDLKASNAEAAGAVGVLIFNYDAGVIFGTLDTNTTVTLPVFGLTYALGELFATTAGLTARMQVTPQDVVEVPAPGSLALAGVGLLLLATTRMRRSG